MKLDVFTVERLKICHRLVFRQFESQAITWDRNVKLTIMVRHLVQMKVIFTQ